MYVHQVISTKLLLEFAKYSSKKYQQLKRERENIMVGQYGLCPIVEHKFGMQMKLVIGAQSR